MDDEATGDLIATAVIAEGPDGALLPGTPIPEQYASIELPGCRLISLLGHGAMGVVFLSRQDRLSRHVAVKMLPVDVARDQVYVSRLESEALTLAALSHPNIVGCYDLVTTDDGLFIVMEYVPGQLNIRDLILRFGRFDEVAAARVVLETARGLSYAKEKGVTHRDVKPENLLFFWESPAPPRRCEELFDPPHARVMICDFGIARRRLPDDAEGDSRPERPVGSPAYMAPEQASSMASADFRADIYALAGTFYHMLTGTTPYHGEDRQQTLQLKRTQAFPDPRKLNRRVTDECARIVARMGAMAPDERYGSYEALIDDLQNLLRHHDAQPTGRLYHHHYPSFWRGVAIGVAAVALIALVAAGVSLRRLFVSEPVSRTASLGYWDGDRSSWRFNPPDDEMEGPALTGYGNGSALVLRQPLHAGDRVRVKVRVFGSGGATISVRDDKGARWSFAWRRIDRNSVFGSAAEGVVMPLAEIGQRRTVEWLTLDFRLRENRVVFLADGNLTCIAPLAEPITDARLRLEVTGNAMAQFSDVLITRAQ